MTFQKQVKLLRSDRTALALACAVRDGDRESLAILYDRIRELVTPLPGYDCWLAASLMRTVRTAQ